MIEQSQITQWLDAENIPYEPSNAEEGTRFAWALIMRPPGALSTALAARAAPHSDLLMEVTVAVADQHKDILRTLDPDARARFMFDLHLALLGKPTGYSLEVSEDDPSVVSRIIVGHRVLEDPLTRAGFFRRQHQIQSAALLVVTMFQKLDRFRAW